MTQAETIAAVGPRGATDTPVAAPCEDGGLAGVSFHAVSHWFAGADDPRPVVAGVTLHVAENEFVAIVGASGCGKTTLLNMAAGLIQPELGRVTVRAGGRRLAPPCPEVGYMWARDSLFPWRRLARNVEFGLELQGVPRAERRTRATAAIALVGLAGHAARYPRELSHGMRQRGNLARLLALDPQIFLFDEPFSALDAQTKNRLQREFSAIWHRRARTVLYVTHDLNEAALLADRVVIMSAGRIMRDIPVPFARPRDIDELRFDAGFQRFAKGLWDLLGEIEGRGA